MIRRLHLLGIPCLSVREKITYQRIVEFTRHFSVGNKTLILSRLSLAHQANINQKHNSQMETDSQVKNTHKALLDFLASKSSSSLSVEGKGLLFTAAYRSLAKNEKNVILRHIAEIWSSQQDAILQSAQAYIIAKSKGEVALIKAEDKLRDSLNVNQAWMLNNIIRLEGGIRFLVDLRADILELVSNENSDVTSLKSLCNAIRDSITPCFAPDLLELEQVMWSSPGHLLQKISEGEAVHPIRSWADLKRRLGKYRRCYMFSTPALPLQPLAIIHVALTNNIPNNIHSLINRTQSASVDVESDIEENFSLQEERQMTTAIFYSISSTQKGLAGIELGQSLIKRTVRRLQAELPTVHQYFTLSPIPGFLSWMLHQLRETERGQSTVLLSADWQQLKQNLNITNEQLWRKLIQLLNNKAWIKEETVIQSLERPLMSLCAHYLYKEKRRGYALDSVANFHLRNGAIMWRINWLADISPRGLQNACGMMVNYRYYLEACEGNSQQYVEKQHIECTEQIRHLAKVNFCSHGARL